MDATEKGVTREITIGVNFRLRLKRHDELGDIASYPTPTFLDFATQPTRTTSRHGRKVFSPWATSG